MPMRRTTARKLVSDSEFKLINESFPPLVGTLSDKALLQRMERARKARDRYHTMVEKRRGKKAAVTQRAGAAPADLKDVLSKERIFDETVARFERQTARTGTRNAGPQAPAAAKSTAKPGAKAVTSGKAGTGRSARRTATGGTKAVSAKKIAATGGGVNTPAQNTMGKKSGSAKSGSQGASKSNVKMANKAAAKADAKTASKTATKAAKGKGGATKNTPRGRHGAMVPATTLR